MTMRIFVPRDAGAVAVGADEVAMALEWAAVKAGIAVEIVRTLSTRLTGATRSRMRQQAGCNQAVN